MRTATLAMATAAMMSHLDRGGFLPLGNESGFAYPGELGPSRPIFQRDIFAGMTDEQRAQIADLERGSFVGDMDQLQRQLGMTMGQIMRGITSSMTAFPVRENLEAEAKILMPLDTPVRNRLPRVPGSGKAAEWKQVTSIGLGVGGDTMTTGSGNTDNTTITVVNAGGFYAGDTILIGNSSPITRIVSSVNYSTNVITVTVTTGATFNSARVVKAGFQPGVGEAVRGFYAETGAPAEQTTVYADKTATYKLMGRRASVTGFSMAAGANFQNQRAKEMSHLIQSVMLLEENALINGDASATAAPWGDGTTALAFDGILALCAVANGVPAEQVQSAVGALTFAHIDAQLSRLWNQGAQGLYMLMNEQETRSMAHLAEASGTMLRVVVTNQGGAVVGIRVAAYVHPVSGIEVPIIPSRFLAPGTIYFGSTSYGEGYPTLEVDVLPQVELPQLAPNDMVQGYTAQEIAPAITSPQVYPFMVSVFEVLKQKSALHVAKSTGVTAV